jgi:hypothetical protein
MPAKQLLMAFKQSFQHGLPNIAGEFCKRLLSRPGTFYEAALDGIQAVVSVRSFCMHLLG